MSYDNVESLKEREERRRKSKGEEGEEEGQGQGEREREEEGGGRAIWLHCSLERCCLLSCNDTNNN
jgi:hypothetical protein